MPFARCIAAALADQLLTQTEHDHYQDVHAAFEADYRAHMPAPEAAAEAARETFRYIEGATAERRRQIFLSLAVKADIERRFDSHINPWTGKNDPYQAAIALYDRLESGRYGLAVEQQHEFWKGQAQAELDGAYTIWKRNMVGQRRNLPREGNIVREIFGERTGDEGAMMLAAGWKKASEQLRQAFNRFGGHIAHLEDWGLPQNHNAKLIREAGFDKWADAIMPMLDRGRMLDRDTGRPLGDNALREALHKAYSSILTGGWDDREPTSTRGRAMANRRDESRFLHFKDADNWMAYQQAFGEADPINAMLSHIDAMSRDVGHMQVMGPNPSATLDWVKAVLSKKAALDNTPEKAVAAHVSLDKLYSNYTRSNSAPVRPRLAHAIDDLGNLLSAAQLGGAVVTAVPSDLNFQRLTRSFNGLPQIKGLATYLKMLNPADATHRLAAIKMGLGAQQYGQILGQQGRYIGEIYGHEWSRWINDRVLTVSGLSAHTAAGRAAFGVDFYGHVADQAGKGFAALDKDFAGMLSRYGIGPAEWDHLRASPTYDVSGAKFIRPADIMARGDMDQGLALDIASKLSDAAQTETEFAVPSGSLMARAIMQGHDHPGELASVAKRSFNMYRTFGATMLLSHGRRMASLGSNPVKLSKYAAGLLIGSMVAGAMAIQAKEIIAGRDPRPMDDWRFWMAAFITGGGGGLLADFVNAGVNGNSAAGQNLGSAIGGPIAGLIGDVSQTFFGAGGIGAVGKEPSATAKNAGTRALEFTKRYMPGGSIWYSRLVIEREMWDQLQSMIDPGWQGRSARIERWYQRQFQTQYWWHRGEQSPERAPDPSNAGGMQ